MKEVFEDYGGVIISALVTVVIISGLALLLSSGESGGTQGALYKMILHFFDSISG